MNYIDDAIPISSIFSRAISSGNVFWDAPIFEISNEIFIDDNRSIGITTSQDGLIFSISCHQFDFMFQVGYRLDRIMRFARNHRTL